MELTVMVSFESVSGQAKRSLSADEYRRAEKLLSHHRRELLAGDCLDINWLDSTTFVYRVTRRDDIHVVYVDVVSKDRHVLFSLREFESLVRQETGQATDLIDIAISDVSAAEERARILVGPNVWDYDYGNHKVANSNSGPVDGAVASPDGHFYAVVNPYGRVEIIERSSGQVVAQTSDQNQSVLHGVEPDQAKDAQLLERLGVTPAAVVLWSPDSRRLLTHRIDQAKVPTMRLIRSSSLHDGVPEQVDYHYPIPGGNAAIAQWVVLDLDNGQEGKVAVEPFEMPWLSPITQQHVWWSEDSRWIYWLDLPRYARSLRVRRFDWEGSRSEVLFEEESDRRIDVAPQLGQPPIARVAIDGESMILWSQRDGRGHLYRHRFASGECRQLTSGEFEVHQLLHVDDQTQQAIVTVTGLVQSDPYRRSVARVSLQSGEVSVLTPDDLDHQCSVSPLGAYMVDIASTITHPPVTALLDAHGDLVMALEHTDVSDLSKLGWRPPLRVETTAADGHTRIYAALHLPIDFDERKVYPVVDHLYPGPQRTRVAPSFHQTYLDQDAEALTALGFVVVAIDGRGTPLREREIQDHSYGALWRASDVDDHVAAIAEMARIRPWMDISRVGVIGRSGGGYAAARSLMVRSDFYTAGVAIAGNHDNVVYQAVWAETFHGPIMDDERHSLSNLSTADRLERPLLLVHGDLDDNVPVYHSARLASVLAALGAPVEFCSVPGAEHCFVGFEHHVAQLSWNHLVRQLHEAQPPDCVLAPARRSEARWGHLRTSELGKECVNATR